MTLILLQPQILKSGKRIKPMQRKFRENLVERRQRKSEGRRAVREREWVLRFL